MEIKFDPLNPDEAGTVLRMLTTTASVTEATGAIGNDANNAASAFSDLAAVTTVDDAGQTTTLDGTINADGETDCHGMSWNDDIHSSPPTKNADGSWRAKRGKKDEYDAAYAALNQPTAPTTPTAPTAPVGMPVSQPATAMPTTPPEPVQYQVMAERFVNSLEHFGVGFEQIYSDLGIVEPHTLETNQTYINRLWIYMEQRAAGADHPTAAGAANASG